MYIYVLLCIINDKIYNKIEAGYFFSKIYVDKKNYARKTECRKYQKKKAFTTRRYLIVIVYIIKLT